MDQISQQKTINAGFTIIRCDDQPCARIKYKGTGVLSWKTLLKFPTKAERDIKFNELLKNQMIISD